MIPIRISSLEWKVIFLGFLGIISAYFLFHITLTQITLMYLLGICFEFITEPRWNYNPILNHSTFTLRDRDVNLFFGIGWVGCLCLIASVGHFIHQVTHLNELWCCIVFGGLVGVLIEKLYFTLGLWSYELNVLGNVFFGKIIKPLFDIPVYVIVGYFILVAPISYLFFEGV